MYLEVSTPFYFRSMVIYTKVNFKNWRIDMVFQKFHFHFQHFILSFYLVAGIKQYKTLWSTVLWLLTINGTLVDRLSLDGKGNQWYGAGAGTSSL